MASCRDEHFPFLVLMEMFLAFYFVDNISVNMAWHGDILGFYLVDNIYLYTWHPAEKNTFPFFF